MGWKTREVMKNISYYFLLFFILYLFVSYISNNLIILNSLMSTIQQSRPDIENRIQPAGSPIPAYPPTGHLKGIYILY